MRGLPPASIAVAIEPAGQARRERGQVASLSRQSALEGRTRRRELVVEELPSLCDPTPARAGEPQRGPRPAGRRGGGDLDGSGGGGVHRPRILVGRAFAKQLLAPVAVQNGYAFSSIR